MPEAYSEPSYYYYEWMFLQGKSFSFMQVYTSKKNCYQHLSCVRYLSEKGGNIFSKKKNLRQSFFRKYLAEDLFMFFAWKTNSLKLLFNLEALWYTFFKKPVYKKLGLRWLKNWETCRGARTFLRKFSYIENLRN